MDEDKARTASSSNKHEQQKTATVATSAKAAAKSAAVPAGASSSSSSGAAVFIPPRCCIACGEAGGKLKRCGPCKHFYCSSACLTHHRAHVQCDALRTQPLLTIADEDRLKPAQARQDRECIIDAAQRQGSLRSNDPHSSDHRPLDRRALSLMSAADRLTSRLYPPDAANALWWLGGMKLSGQGQMTSMFALQFVHASVCLFELISALCGAGQLPSFGQRGSAHLPPGFARLSSTKGTPIVLHPSRYLHKMLAHAIYFYRHVDRRLLLPELRSLVSAESDEEGVLPFGPTAANVAPVAYIRGVDSGGRATLFPCVMQLRTGRRWLYGSVRLSDRWKLAVYDSQQRQLITEGGLLIVSAKTGSNKKAQATTTTTQIFALTGPTKDPRTSWDAAPVLFVHESGVPRATERSHVEQGDESKGAAPTGAVDRSHPLHALPEELGDAWPEEDGEVRFIAVSQLNRKPKSPSSSQLPLGKSPHSSKRAEEVKSEPTPSDASTQAPAGSGTAAAAEARRRFDADVLAAKQQAAEAAVRAEARAAKIKAEKATAGAAKPFEPKDKITSSSPKPLSSFFTVVVPKPPPKPKQQPSAAEPVAQEHKGEEVAPIVAPATPAAHTAAATRLSQPAGAATAGKTPKTLSSRHSAASEAASQPDQMSLAAQLYQALQLTSRGQLPQLHTWAARALKSEHENASFC
jgi:hypothetical protein